MTLQEKVLTPLPDDECDIWVFGFGSLVHHPGFAYEERVEGFIRGWRRVFWQGSTDHRGVPEKPGRTVTLVEDSSSITWGAAYRLVGSRAEQQRTLQYLEWREKQYDRRVWVAVHRLGAAAGDPPAVAQALTFVATNDRAANPNYLGPASEEAIAAQVAAAAGPSGPNRDYVFRLADAMRTMGVDDPDLFSLEARVRALVAEQAAAGVGVAAGVGAAEGAAAEDAGCATEGQQPQQPQQQPPPPVPA